MRRRIAAALMLVSALAGCGGGNHAPPARVPARAGVLHPPSTQETQACLTDLARMDVRVSALADHDYGGGCGLVGTVQLIDIGVPVTGVKALRCGLARAFVGWIDHAVAPAAYQILGSRLVRIETMGSYACRAVVGNSAAAGRLSGHAIANALDVSGFDLADGRRVTVQANWRDPNPAVRQFLDAIHRSACRRFGTVLSPDYNAAHHDHLHLEDDHAGFCR